MDSQYRLLSFIAACNRSSYNPTSKEVMLWFNNPKPTEAEYRTVPGLAALVGAGPPSGLMTSMADLVMGRFGYNARLDALYSDRKELVKAAETRIEHMVRIGWLEVVGSGIGDGERRGLGLTGLGEALIRDRDREVSADDDVTVVVLGRNDPLAYPLLIGRFSAAGAGLLVDAYLKLENLHDMVALTGLTRFLVSGKPENKKVVDSMRAYLASPSIVRPVEVRASKGLHDRYLIADAGAVLTLGTSINGVGRTTTAMTEMPETAADALRDEYERLWGEAVLVGPQPDEAVDGGEAEKPAAKPADEVEPPPKKQATKRTAKKAPAKAAKKAAPKAAEKADAGS